MISVGITGQPGFVGTHLFEALGQFPEKFRRVPFEDAFFEDESKLRAFVKQCDVIVHLAAMMRSPIEGEVYKVNMRLVHQLVNAMDSENVSPCILFSSSIQEGNGSEYGRCKQEGREMLEKWAKEHNTGFVGMVFPNLFGPGARPNSHSFIATFCYKLTHGETPQVIVDNTVPLKYIGNLKHELLSIIENSVRDKDTRTILFSPEFSLKVTDVLHRLVGFMEGVQPIDDADYALYETLISYKKYNL
jgi:UDP-2-acetamido-2,6-beta-L-arabino-hexul-4-ose reductase